MREDSVLAKQLKDSQLDYAPPLPSRSIREVKTHGGAEPKLPRLVVMIPCLNESRSVGTVIQSIPRDVPLTRDTKVLVVDDGSDDGTGTAASRAGADRIVRHHSRLGLGRAVRNGLDVAMAMGADVVVNIDADGQYDATEIPLLVDPILRGQADIVLGNRQIERLTHMPRSRKWGNKVASWAMRRLSGLSIEDSQTGFRALSRTATLKLNLSADYTYTQEMLIQAAQRDLIVSEVPVTFRKRENGDSRLIKSAWSYAIRCGIIMMRSYGN